jgi:hypothetical protein
MVVDTIVWPNEGERERGEKREDMLIEKNDKI